MRLRLRGPGGASTVTLSDDATIKDLVAQITEKTSIAKFDVKYGYPPRPFDLSAHPTTTLLSDLDVKLNNEQLTISSKEPPEVSDSSKEVKGDKDDSSATKPTSSPSKQASDKSSKKDQKIALKKKKAMTDVPELLMPDRDATLIMRVMPDDNSCLFRAFATANLPGDYQSMPELRSLVASAIQQEPDVYSKVVLEQDPDDYCRWIKTDDAWGGAIEMGILAKHFEVEICSIDVQSLRVDTFTPPPPSPPPKTRCILIYSGIHYDTIVQTPFSNSPPGFDKAVFDTSDDQILVYAQELCQKLQAKHYYTDTGGMAILCKDCGTVLKGQGEAGEHATRFGHWNMEEVRTAGT